jgi:hypothetical protein
MRTTLNLEEDVLETAKQLARQQRKTVGQVVSELVRQALQPHMTARVRNGVMLFEPKPDAKPAHLKIVNELRDSE